MALVTRSVYEVARRAWLDEFVVRCVDCHADGPPAKTARRAWLLAFCEGWQQISLDVHACARCKARHAEVA